MISLLPEGQLGHGLFDCGSAMARLVLGDGETGASFDAASPDGLVAHFLRV